MEGRGRGMREVRASRGQACLCQGSRTSVPGDSLPMVIVSQAPWSQRRMECSLSLASQREAFLLHKKNVKLPNPMGNLDRVQLAAWVLLLGTAREGRDKGLGSGGGMGSCGGGSIAVELFQGRATKDGVFCLWGALEIEKCPRPCSGIAAAGLCSQP